jgi:hypothetical protein
MLSSEAQLNVNFGPRCQALYEVYSEGVGASRRPW